MDYFFVSFLCIISLAKTEETKRLLLNDPDVIGSRLSNIEKSMQEMTRLTSQLQTEFGQEKAKMQTIIFQLQTALTQVLKGFATGQEYSRGTYYGGPANYLCLPNNPELSNITGPGRSVLYGTEFEHGDYFKKGADQEDVPCALCRSENTSTTVMIPGRQTCYSGWKMEYHGILGSNAYEYKASSYICVDSDPEYVQGGERNNNENLIYPTTAKCGSLPCPPYDQGSVYVRWGRKQCSALNTVLVYTGFATGQEYSRGTYYGGPANYLCLPNNPELSNITGPGRSVLYGTEFEHGDYFKKGADQEDVPCALCRSENTSTTVMIPGRQTCYSGWKMEYHGILGSNAYEYKASSYICVDSDPEYVQGGERNNNENLIYPTTAKCGSLPCPPYGNNLLINCVVCSK